MKDLKTRDLILMGIIAILVVFMFTQRGQNSKLKRLANSNTEIINEKQAEIRRIQLENGRLKQEKPSAQGGISKKELALIEENYQEEIEDLKNNHNVKVRDLHSYYKGELRTVGSGRGQVKDTTIFLGGEPVDFAYVSFFDEYLDFAGWYQASIDSMFDYQYTYEDDLSIVYHWTTKGIWPFKRKDELLVSFSASNPNTILNNATSFSIVDKRRTRLTIGPYIGYDPFNAWSVGLSIQKPLIRIRW